MKCWAERPTEIANLLNPAFCCVCLSSSVLGYCDLDSEGMPYPLSFMVLPIVLHKTTRETLPRDIRTSLLLWLQQHPEAKVQYAERVIALKPHTREALIFGSVHGYLSFEKSGRIKAMATNAQAGRFVRLHENEARECVGRARFVGKWLASGGTAATVMALWGIGL